MKALTLHQPWASLIALGVKTIETRSWACPPSLIGQPLAIHAGKGKADPADPVWDTLRSAGMVHGVQILPPLAPLPRAVVVATCRVAACVPMFHIVKVMMNPDDVPWPNVQFNGPDVVSLVQSDGTCTDLDGQRPYGDFRPGRYAWLLEDVKPTTERCPACWGCGNTAGKSYSIGPGWNTSDGIPQCPTCHGVGHCPPVPARGRQRVWNWEPCPVRTECLAHAIDTNEMEGLWGGVPAPERQRMRARHYRGLTV
jgi:hypothetical protein